jgi:hypothetical protein
MDINVFATIAATAAVTFGATNLNRIGRVKDHLSQLGRQLGYLTAEFTGDSREARGRSDRIEQRVGDVHWTTKTTERAVAGLQRTSGKTEQRLDRIEQTHRVGEALRAARTPGSGAARHTLRAGHLRAARDGARPRRDGRSA